MPALINVESDLICVSLDFPTCSEVIKKSLFDTHHLLIADPSHPLVGRREVNVDAFQGYSCVVLKNDFVGKERILSFFAANGLEPSHTTVETTSIHSLLQGLKGGNYLAHIPEQMLPLAKANGLTQIRIRQTFWETTGGFAYRTNQQLTAPMQQITGILTETLMEDRYR